MAHHGSGSFPAFQDGPGFPMPDVLPPGALPRPAASGVPATISWATTGRVALAVFIGSLLALTVFGLAVWIYVGYELHNVGEQISKDLGTSTTSTKSLSAPCRAAIDNGTDSTIPCTGDDPAAILAYEAK